MLSITQGPASVQIDEGGLKGLTYQGSLLFTGGYLPLVELGEDFRADRAEPLGPVLRRGADFGASGPTAAKGRDATQTTTYRDGEVVCVYSWSGDMLTISATIFNHSSRELNLPMIRLGEVGLPLSDFGPGQFRTMNRQQILNEGQPPRSRFHPCSYQQASAACVQIGSTVMAAWSAAPGKMPFALLRLPGDTANNLGLAWATTISPNTSATLTARLRFAPLGTTWEELLWPWQQEFRATWGGLRYDADNRPIVEGINYMGHDRNRITSANPYGMREEHRFDTDFNNAAAWRYGVATNAAALGCQGWLDWGFGFSSLDEDSWGYPHDTAELPVGISGAYLELRNGLANLGLWTGGLQRATIHRVPLLNGGSWNIVADGSTASVEMGVRRFTRAGNCYLDTTPQEQGSELIPATYQKTIDHLREVRKRMGRNPQWWTEHFCDLLLPYAGVYATISDDSPTLPDAVRIARYLYPECGALLKDTRTGNPTWDRDEWLARCNAWNVAGLVADWLI